MRLVFIDLLMAMVGGGFAFLVGRDENTRRLFSRSLIYALLIVPVGLLATGIVLAVQKYNKNVEENTLQQQYLMNQAKAEFLRQENLKIQSERKIALTNALEGAVPKSASALEILETISSARSLGYSDNEIEGSINTESDAYIKATNSKKGSSFLALVNALVDATRDVKPSDFKKIVVSDIRSGSRGSSSLASLFGRIQNDLPQTIEWIDLKVYFYDQSKNLADVREISINEFKIAPRDVVGFESYLRPEVKGPPDGWTWSTEVISAKYAQ